MSRFTESNPLVTGQLPEGFVGRTRDTNFMDEIDLSDLVEAKKAFINPDAVEGGTSFRDQARRRAEPARPATSPRSPPPLG